MSFLTLLLFIVSALLLSCHALKSNQTTSSTSSTITTYKQSSPLWTLLKCTSTADCAIVNGSVCYQEHCLCKAGYHRLPRRKCIQRYCTYDDDCLVGMDWATEMVCTGDHKCVCKMGFKLDNAGFNCSMGPWLKVIIVILSIIFLLCMAGAIYSCATGGYRSNLGSDSVVATQTPDQVLVCHDGQEDRH